jgi:hypothetical protein
MFFFPQPIPRKKEYFKNGSANDGDDVGVYQETTETFTLLTAINRHSLSVFLIVQFPHSHLSFCVIDCGLFFFLGEFINRRDQFDDSDDVCVGWVGYGHIVGV